MGKIYHVIYSHRKTNTFSKQFSKVGLFIAMFDAFISCLWYGYS